MRYILVARGGSDVLRREISKEDFNQVERAQTALLEVLYIEEKFDLLTENYCEFEEEILSSALRYIAFDSDAHEAFQQSRQAIARRLVNLLTTCRLYLDQSSHHIAAVFGPSSSHEEHHQAEKATQYDKYLSYRMLEALRNYAQHRGFPFHVISFSSSVVKLEPGADTVTIVMPKLSVSQLEKDGDFKASVLQELKAKYGDEIDLRPHVRQYIDCLHSVQAALRGSLQESIAGWKDAIYGARDSLSEGIARAASIWALELIAEDDHGEGQERTLFALRSMEIHERYAKKNRLRRPLSSAFVSGQINPEQSG